MSATEDRVRELFRKHLGLGRDPDFDAGLEDSMISSMDAVEFIQKVGEAFDMEIPPEDFAKFENLRDLVGYLDARSR